MKIWDYFKSLFNKQKRLSEPPKVDDVPKQIYIPRKQSEKESFDFKLREGVGEIKPTTLEFAISQYMDKILEHKNKGMGINPYNALIQLGALDNKNSGNNALNEMTVLDNIQKGVYNKNIILDPQNDKNGMPVFYHVGTPDKMNGSYQYRIYLNAKKENVAMLAHKIIQKYDKNGFYFKFNSNENKYSRAEQFVFYANTEEELYEAASIIDSVEKENPKLFEESKSVNPFLKTCDGCDYLAYAPEVSSRQYIDLNGNSKEAPSYNSLLACALEEAFLLAMKDMAKNNFNIEENSDVYSFTNLTQLANSGLLQVVSEDPSTKMEFAKKVKNNLKIISSQNKDLDIKGLDDDNDQKTSEYTNQI